jgi:hypothetical protein
MNNLSKLLDDGTLKIKKINMGKPNNKKTYKKMMKKQKNMKGGKTQKRNKNKNKSPKIIIKKENKTPKQSNNNQKILNRVIDNKIQKVVDQVTSSNDDKKIKPVEKIYEKRRPLEKKRQLEERERQVKQPKVEEKRQLEERERQVKQPKVEEKRQLEERERQVERSVKKKQPVKKKLKHNKTKKLNISDMIEKLKNKGILVSGKNKKLVKDIYLYALDDNIKIYRK